MIVFTPLSSSIAIHDNWECSCVSLLCALINNSPEQLIVIVRNKKERSLYPDHAKVVIWPIGEKPPNLENVGGDFTAMVVTNVFPLNEQIQWWLEKSKYPFVLGKSPFVLDHNY